MIVFWILSALVSSVFSTALSPNVSPTVKPTSTVQQAVVSPTPTDIPTPTFTPTPTAMPTFTPIPTKAVYIFPTATPTSAPVQVINTPSHAAINYDNPYPGASALCNDGTLSYSKHRQGTCSHHGGVSGWL